MLPTGFYLATECITWIPKKTSVMQFYSAAHKTALITFTNCLQSDILEAVAPKYGEVERVTANILIAINIPNNTKK